jgi:ATP-binding protein involved in chromosome partitioning
VTTEDPHATVGDPRIWERLGLVVDPELGRSIVELGMVRSVELAEGGRVAIEVALTTPGCPLRAQIERDVRSSVLLLEDVTSVELSFGSMTPEENAALMSRVRKLAQEDAPATTIPAATKVLGISSGKGGVGKSSITVNLGVALARRGLSVGMLDADIWGFSVPRLLGMAGPVEARDKKMVPLERAVGAGRLSVLSMGFLADEDSAIMWRGLLLSRALQQFIEDAWWGDLDVLLIDLPPGTGDVQMSLARLLPRTELLVVTTPPLAAQQVAARAADMARKGHLRVAGVIENMAPFACEHGTTYALFGEGGGAALAERLGVPLLGSIPLDPAVVAGGDAGTPAAEGEGPLAAAFAALAERVVAEVVPASSMGGCSARLARVLEGLVEAP